MRRAVFAGAITLWSTFAYGFEFMAVESKFDGSKELMIVSEIPDGPALSLVQKAPGPELFDNIAIIFHAKRFLCTGGKKTQTVKWLTINKDGVQSPTETGKWRVLAGSETLAIVANDTSVEEHMTARGIYNALIEGGVLKMQVSDECGNTLVGAFPADNFKAAFEKLIAYNKASSSL